jgi:signal transduction histidine kinase
MMDATTAAVRHSSPPAAPTTQGGRWLHGLTRAVAIVAIVVVIMSLNTTSYKLVTKPISVWLEAFIGELISHAIIGIAILAAAMWVRYRIPTQGARQYVAAAIAVAVSTTFALVVLYAISQGGMFDEPWPWPARKIISFASEVFRYSFLGAVITCAWLYLCTEAEHAAAAERVAIDASRMDRETTEARLQMLEAQIEPHFLFNTLAHVKRLYETDRHAGVRMLRNLKDYLSIALPQMREGAPTLGREIDHVVAYLGIQQIRMGRRLAYGVDVPKGLRDARVPSLMVLTLVENAVKHGLTPLPQGGRIDVRVTASGASLRIDVADTGRGFAKSQGGGTGLANIRARLASTYGPAARLSLALKQPAGVIATIELPLEPATPVITPS